MRVAKTFSLTYRLILCRTETKTAKSKYEKNCLAVINHVPPERFSMQRTAIAAHQHGEAFFSLLQSKKIGQFLRLSLSHAAIAVF